MIHEVMVLDHSGPPFGAILYGAAIKLLVLGMLVVRVLVPVTTADPWLDLALFAGLLLVLAVLVGVVESTMARLRLLHVPNLLIAATLLSGFGFLLLVTWP
jgi:formate hydrogenlyase subunit 4